MTELNKIYNMDCLEGMKQLPTESVDLIATDPPYQLSSITNRYGKEGAAPPKFGTDGVFQRVDSGFMGKSWEVLQDDITSPKPTKINHPNIRK